VHHRLLPLILSPLGLFLQARAEAAGKVLVWAHPDQAAGATDSSAALLDSLGRLGIEAVAASDLLAQDLSGFQGVAAVLGTFPRKHLLTADEAAALAGYLHERRGALYLEGGDSWYDLPPVLAPLLGIGLDSDGAGDLSVLAGLDASPGPDLGGLTAPYDGENRSLDRLSVEGDGRPLWVNRDTGSIHAAYSGPAGGYRVIGSSFEFGGLTTERDEVLRSYLIALGLLESCGPPVAGLRASVTGRRVNLQWTNREDYESVAVTRDGEPPAALPGGSQEFEEEPGPGEHHYQVVAGLKGCVMPAAFSTAAVLEGAHVVVRPVETLPGLGDSAREIELALVANGRLPVTVKGLEALDLRGAAGLWVALGTRPFHHQLSMSEGQLLADYLTGASGPARPRLYLEGGDVWGSDPPTALRALDGVKLEAQAGLLPLRHLRGLDSGQGFSLSGLVRLPVDYTSETESLDSIAADPEVPGAGAVWIDDDSGDVLGVFRRDPAGRFALLSASFEFGGITHTRKERALLMGLYLTALESPAGPLAPLFRRGDADGNGVLGLSDPIQVLQMLFLGGSLDQDCADAADVDDDGAVGLTDAVVLLNYLFLAGPPPPPPGPASCGADPTPDDGLPECHPLAGGCG
jgi:hypothetical protein